MVADQIVENAEMVTRVDLVQKRPNDAVGGDPRMLLRALDQTTTSSWFQPVSTTYLQDVLALKCSAEDAPVLMWLMTRLRMPTEFADPLDVHALFWRGDMEDVFALDRLIKMCQPFVPFERVQQQLTEENEENKEQDSAEFKRRVVLAYCEKVLPSELPATGHANQQMLVEWHSVVQRVLSLVVDVHVDGVAAIHKLRMFSDLASLLLIPHHLPFEILAALSRISPAGNAADEFFTSPLVFDYVLNIGKQLRVEQPNNAQLHACFERFLCHYFGRALDALLGLDAQHLIVRQLGITR